MLRFLKGKVNTSHLIKVADLCCSIFIINHHVLQFLHGHSFSCGSIELELFTIISFHYCCCREWCMVKNNIMHICKQKWSTYWQQQKNTSTKITAKITTMTIIGTTIAATVPSKLSLDAGSEYGTTLTMTKPSMANAFIRS